MSVVQYKYPATSRRDHMFSRKISGQSEKWQRLSSGGTQNNGIGFLVVRILFI